MAHKLSLPISRLFVGLKPMELEGPSLQPPCEPFGDRLTLRLADQRQAQPCLRSLSPSRTDRRLAETRPPAPAIPMGTVGVETLSGDPIREHRCLRKGRTVRLLGVAGLYCTALRFVNGHCALRNVGGLLEGNAQSGGELERGGGPPLSAGPAGRAGRLRSSLQAPGPSPRTKRCGHMVTHIPQR